MSKQATKSAKRSVEINGVEFTVSQTKLRNGEPIMIAFLRGQRGAVHRARTEDAMMAKLAEIAQSYGRAEVVEDPETFEDSADVVLTSDDQLLEDEELLETA